MNYDELLREINENEEKIAAIRKRFSVLKNDKKKLSRLYISSAFFNLKDITTIIADYISYNENKPYTVLNLKTSDPIYNSSHYAICEEEKQEILLKKYNNENNKIINDNNDIILIDNYSYDSLDTDKEKISNRNISFIFLWSKFNFNDLDFDFYDINLCLSDFKGYEYVKDFIYYLFNLQIINNGRHLHYEELQKALQDYIKITEVKKKKRIQK